ncbi:hypothetical protein DDZ18_09735 [Marinicauda salina]|uniref:Uncharacterized protein n=1 Tax=Marinicauda salina TaxID=2135793 RepID=A0A2U2BSJ6_9PROT|nr:hypothetical protein [Marinicauda salina]PWE16979.1 hypothetical protein DDZ18_09735 [Marinicauda salina]
MTRLATPAAAVLAGLAASAAAAAQDLEESPTVEALLACRDIADDAERAACLDTQVAAFADAVDSGRLVIVERERVTAVERDSFGISLPSLPGLSGIFARGDGESETVEVQDDGVELVRDRSGEIDELRHLPVDSVRRTRRGDLVVTLENGQVWRQLDSTRIPVPRGSRLDGLTAEIRRASLGSFMMTLSHNPRAFRARRDD